MKINWHAIAAAATTSLGIALSPAVFGVLPPKAAAVVGALGIVYQAFTKPAVEAAPSAPTSTPTAG